MTTSEVSDETMDQAPKTRPVDQKLEVAVVPVADADRAKDFYASLGWREDGDLRIGDDYRIVQFTPTGSQASIIFGAGVTAAVPGAGGSLVLAVSDIDAARADQELTTRFPGRTDIAAIAELLHETAEHHDAYERSSPPHDWWHWYAAYFDARQAGSAPQEASALAGRYMNDAGLV